MRILLLILLPTLCFAQYRVKLPTTTRVDGQVVYYCYSDNNKKRTLLERSGYKIDSIYKDKSGTLHTKTIKVDIYFTETSVIDIAIHDFYKFTRSENK